MSPSPEMSERYGCTRVNDFLDGEQAGGCNCCKKQLQSMSHPAKSNSSGVSYQNELVRIGLQNTHLRHDALNGVPNSRLWGIGPFSRVFDPVPP